MKKSDIEVISFIKDMFIAFVLFKKNINNEALFCFSWCI